MWTPLKIEIGERFAAVESFFKATRGLGGGVEQTAKGIAFVQMYAAYEYTVRAVVRTAVDSMITQGHLLQDLEPPLMALFLDSELTSLKACSPSNIWSARIKIFEKVFSGISARVHNTVFPIDGSHFRHKQLQTIFSIFGIKRSPAHRGRHLIRIDEVVGNRNSIAHGHETADQVGGRYTRSEVSRILKQVNSVCLLLISTMEKQCSDSKRYCRKK